MVVFVFYLEFSLSGCKHLVVGRCYSYIQPLGDIAGCPPLPVLMCKEITNVRQIRQLFPGKTQIEHYQLSLKANVSSICVFVYCYHSYRKHDIITMSCSCEVMQG